MEAAFKYIMAAGGIDSEKDYSYNATDAPCWTAAEKRHVATIDNFVAVKPRDEDQLAAALALNPISVSIEADHPVFQHYKTGVISNASACGDKLDHGVLVVGMTAGSWIIKNSWGCAFFF